MWFVKLSHLLKIVLTVTENFRKSALNKSENE